MLLKDRRWFRLARIGPGKQSDTPPLPWPVWGQAAWGDRPFGRGCLRKNGCQPLAAAWAARLCGADVAPERIVRDYQQGRRLLLWGRWGCDPHALPEVLSQYGLNCREYSDFSGFSAAAARDGVFVLIFWNGDKLWQGAHGVALQRKNERLWVYGRYNHQVGPVELNHLSLLTASYRFIVGYQVQ